MIVFKEKRKAGFIIKDEKRPGYYLKNIKSLFKGTYYDFFLGKLGAAVFTRNKKNKVLNQLRESGFRATAKAIGKGKI